MHKLTEYLKTNPKKHIIFDLDETILRLEIPWEAFITKAWEMFDRIDRELVLAHPQTVTRANNMMNMLIAKHGDSVKEEIYSYLEFFESKYLKGITPNSELIEWINKNNGKYKFHLWTSQMSRSLDKILPMAGLEDVFTQKIARDMVKMAKPYPYGFELIFAEQGGEKQDYLMVGDSEFDEGAAKNAGIDYYFENFFKK